MPIYENKIQLKDIDDLSSYILIALQANPEFLQYANTLRTSEMEELRYLVSNSMDIVSNLDVARSNTNPPHGPQLVYRAHLQLLSVNIFVNDFVPKTKEKAIVSEFFNFHKKALENDKHEMFFTKIAKTVKGFFNWLFNKPMPEKIETKTTRQVPANVPAYPKEFKAELNEKLGTLDAEVGLFHHAVNKRSVQGVSNTLTIVEAPRLRE